MDLAVLAADAAGLIWSLLRWRRWARMPPPRRAQPSSRRRPRAWSGGCGTACGAHRAVEAAAEEDAPDALEELARQITRLLKRDEALATEVRPGGQVR